MHFYRSLWGMWNLQTPCTGGSSELISKYLSSVILYNHSSYFKSGEINSCRLSPLPTVSSLYPIGCTPLNTVPILSCVKAYSKNHHFRVFIMIKIGQTHVFLKDCVHIHQIGSHFVGGYRLDFLPGGQETRRSFFKLLALGSPRLL